MKKLVIVFTISLFFIACNKNDDQMTQLEPELLKVIDKIEVKITTGSNPPSIYTTQFSYNSNKEISKLVYLFNDTMLFSYTYIYQNNVPVSSIYDFPGGGDPAYQVNYGYSNGVYASYYDTYYDTTIAFSYNEQFNQYTNIESNNRYILNEFDDITTKYLSTFGNEYAYTYDTTKKGPLYNVVNKKWIPILWYGISNKVTNELSIYPITSIFDDNIAQNNPFINTYDVDGFIEKSEFSLNNGNQAYEIIYTYILL